MLTDGQGSVSKWSEPAELLFGRPAEDILGQSFFETLIQAPVPAAAESWRRFLEAGEAPTAAGRIEVAGQQADGSTFPMEAVFVPVKLDEGFDFSLFLEDLGFELPMNLMLQRMRAQHPVVVRALRQALEPEPQPWEGWRTAGTLVVFRPLKATPWVEAELARREAVRAAADAEVEERLTNLDPGIQGDSVAELDDAAAVVARLLSAMERIDELERVALGLPGQLEEARQSTERRVDAAEREAQSLRAEMNRVLATAPTGGVDEGQLPRAARPPGAPRARQAGRRAGRTGPCPRIRGGRGRPPRARRPPGPPRAPARGVLRGRRRPPRHRRRRRPAQGRRGHLRGRPPRRRGPHADRDPPGRGRARPHRRRRRRERRACRPARAGPRRARGGRPGGQGRAGRHDRAPRARSRPRDRGLPRRARRRAAARRDRPARGRRPA